MKRLLAVLIFALSAGSVLNGCATEAPPDDQTRITVSQLSETDFRADAEDGQSRATFIIHRNGLRGADFIRDPIIDSPYDADLIVRNRHGHPFLASGNHGMPPDPETGTYPEPQTFFSRQEQIDDLRLAVAATEKLQHQQVASKIFGWELRSLYFMAMNGLKDAEEAPSNGTSYSLGNRGDTTGVISSALTAPYTHTVAIRKAVCCNSLGEHSAVRLSVKDSAGTFVGAVSTRNHGREADDPSMSNAFNCPQSWGGRNVAFPAFQPYVNTDNAIDGDAGGCNTSYGFSTGQHVCNDDSQAQYWNIKNNTSGTWAVCSDSTLNYWAPYCD